jgi:multidrug efflux pump
MYLLGYSIDNLSLMALTIATGFVVDDAIVVLENIARHVEAGQTRLAAALEGAREVGFTVLSMSLSLVAVFLPILLMGGLLGRIFREFAVTLSLAIVVSLVVSLTTTPMMCRYLLAPPREREPGRLARWTGRALGATLHGYERSLGWTLRHPALVLLSLLATVGLNVYLFTVVPKGLLPDQDTGRLIGGIQADQSVSFALMKEKLAQLMAIVRSDPTVETAVGFTGGGQTNSGFMFVSLKPYGERDVTAQQVVDRLRPRLAEVPGARLFLSAVQDFRMGGRQTNANYQFTLMGDSTAELYEWGPKLVAALADVPQLADVNSDQQQKGLETQLAVDRTTAARLGLSPAAIDNTLYDAFGQRQVSTIYNPLNQYHVVMELAPEHQQDPDALRGLYVSTSGGPARGTQTSGLPSAVAAGDPARNQATNALAAKGRGASSGSAVSTTPETMVPLSAFADYRPANTPLAVNHQGPFVATTISFNLPPGVSLGDAAAAIRATMAKINMPATIHGGFAGTAAVFVGSLGDEPLLILAAIGVVYIVLGILYESLVHPITILSTLPSAGVGAVLALMLFGKDLSIIALIGVFLLIGIVKKNAIMMVDVALDAERREGLAPREAILRACSLRFRPIMMTTFAAILGALPLAIGVGEGAELRQPLGISIVGGLVVSQFLTLYTTPVVYLCLERLRLRRRAPAGVLAAQPAE